ncbi:hypothetical protein GCM10027321_47650 [Massilia terrae]|uniref:Uncharacterized protein n=1 Tax=Massilia terrae TaxID=1811224 RepID=A0ABT2D1M8_9BURK|nr:hypothetical protein [Massilia terrae]MCS0660146.1 hypothetical protein [Massilia terrae]
MHPIFLRCVAGLALAAGSAAASPPATYWTAVSPAVLDSARGGFTIGAGLALSFGLERLVSLNGEIVARTSVQLPDIGRLSTEQVRQTGAALSAVNLIQAGADNIFAQPAPGQMVGAMVIQNSLDGQAIRSQTVINASVNGLALLQALHFERSLADALAGAASPH